MKLAIDSHENILSIYFGGFQMQKHLYGRTITCKFTYKKEDNINGLYIWDTSTKSGVVGEAVEENMQALLAHLSIYFIHFISEFNIFIFRLLLNIFLPVMALYKKKNIATKPTITQLQWLSKHVNQKFEKQPWL
jgi:hypothetical protein